LHFRFSFEPRFSEVDKSIFLGPPLRAMSCNVHYSGSIWQWKRDLEQVYWSVDPQILGRAKRMSVFSLIKTMKSYDTEYYTEVHFHCLLRKRYSSWLMIRHSASTVNRCSHPPGYDALALITFGTTGLKLNILIQ
jgi:hypothetical protein